MERISAPNGSQVNLETLIDTVQSRALLNINNRIKSIVSTPGFLLSVTNGAYSADFSLSLNNSDSTISCFTGSAIFPNYEYVTTTVALTIANPCVGQTTKGFAVILNYRESGTSPVKALNAFVYDKLGSASLSRNTVFTDSAFLTTVEITSNITAIKNSLTSNQLLVGVVYSHPGFSSSDAGLSSYPVEIVSATYGISDLRLDSRAQFSSSLIADTKVLYKDRPSTGSNKFNQQIEFGQTVTFSGTIDMGVNAGLYLTSANLAPFEINSSTGNHARFLQEGGVSKAYIPSLKVKSVVVNAGTDEVPDWRNVVLQSSASASPRNLRIYDIYPTRDANERKGYVMVKWNWDKLQVEHWPPYFTIMKTSYTNEPVVFTNDDMSTYLIGKKLKMPSGLEYTITAVSDQSSHYRISIAETFPTGGANTTSNTPGLIKDSNVDYYTLRFIADDAGVLSEENDFITVQLDGARTTHLMKLELNRSYTAQIQSVSGTSFSAVYEMPAGSYDPDHAAGGQAVVNYTSPFSMVLPNLAASGSFDTIATKQGFQVTISGWSGVTYQETAQEFEVFWSTAIELNLDNFETSEVVQRLVTSARIVDIPVPLPTVVSVAVRPLQNKQAVYAPVFKKVSSGGGGIAPQSQVLFDEFVSIASYRGVVVQQSPVDGRSFYIKLYNAFTGEREAVSASYVLGKKAVLPTLSSQLIDFSTDLTFTNSTTVTNASASYLGAPSAPNPKVISFVLSSTATTATIEADETKWAKFRTSTEWSLIKGNRITFKASASLFNWGPAKMSIYLINASNGQILAQQKIVKTSTYPTTDSHLINISYFNGNSSAVDVYLEVRAWSNHNGFGFALPTTSFAQILVDTYSSSVKIWSTTYTSGGYTAIADFNSTRQVAGLHTDGVVNNSSNHVNITYFKPIKADNADYVIGFDSDSVLGWTEGSEFLIGVSKHGRFITEKTLPVDFNINSVEFYSLSATGVGDSVPGLIRVYPKGLEGSSALLEVEGYTGSNASFKTTPSLQVKLNNNERVFVIDAFDPSEAPNNFCEFSGRLVVMGSPIVIDNISTASRMQPIARYESEMQF